MTSALQMISGDNQLIVEIDHDSLGELRLSAGNVAQLAIMQSIRGSMTIFDGIHTEKIDIWYLPLIDVFGQLIPPSKVGSGEFPIEYQLNLFPELWGLTIECSDVEVSFSYEERRELKAVFSAVAFEEFLVAISNEKEKYASVLDRLREV